MKSGKVLPLLSLLFVPIFSFALYQVVGSARDLALPGILAELQTVETEAEQLALLTELADFLQARFERQEDDVQNGYMLGTLYLELDRYQDAIDTFRQLADGMDAGMDKATVLGQLAQSLFLQSESEMTPEIRNITDQALVMNPNEYAVMSLLAMDALLNEDIVGAVGYWRRQLLQVNAGNRDAAVLRDRITRAETMFPDLFEGDTAAPDGPSVTVIVDIDESVVDRVTDDMRLFVFARNPAMPAPLAAENLPLPASFPIEITLDNTKSMIAGMNLSTATDVIVGARLTRGGATAESGDIQALSDAFSLADQQGPVSLTIKDIVP
jgi:cytochrome c-type biogenesis protein CcmH